MKIKLLYLMHAPWSWIKQRPHFIAEELSKIYILSVFAEKEKNGKVPYHDIKTGESGGLSAFSQ